MNMKNKEQLLYFFLQGKISLSQYDYKFMANLQTMIQNSSRVTSNQADLFDKLISKYKKQLVKNGFVKEELKELPWKTMIVESTPEYTGASVRLMEDDIIIRVPFNKSFISQFRQIEDNKFSWDSAEKIYRAKFNTLSLKIAHEYLPKYFSHVKYCTVLTELLDQISEYANLVWNPTAVKFNDGLLVVACNEILGSIITNQNLEITPRNLFNLSKLGIRIDPAVYDDDEKLRFAASNFYETDINDFEKTISWMRNVGCDNVILGRGIRSVSWKEELTSTIEKHGMKVYGPLNISATTITGITMMVQHVSANDKTLAGPVNKTIVIKDSRPIEVL
jgi:hypothetical protein